MLKISLVLMVIFALSLSTHSLIITIVLASMAYIWLNVQFKNQWLISGILVVLSILFNQRILSFFYHTTETLTFVLIGYLLVISILYPYKLKEKLVTRIAPFVALTYFLVSIQGGGLYLSDQYFYSFWALLPLFYLILSYTNKHSAEKRAQKEKKKIVAQFKEKFEPLKLELEKMDQLPTEQLWTKEMERKTNVYMTLDEQFVYLEGLHEKIMARFERELNQKFDFPLVTVNYRNEKRLSSIFNGSWPFYLSEEAIAFTREYKIHSDELRKSFTRHYNQAKFYIQDLAIKQKINEHYQRIEKGIRGEEQLVKELDFISDNLFYLTNVRIEIDGLSSESDALVFSPYGIFTIEAKNFGEEGHYAIHVSKDGKWTKKVGNKQYQMDDVVAQSNRHVIAKEKLLNRSLRKSGALSEDGYINIEGVITITNNVVEIENETDFPIMRLSHLYTYMRKNEVKYNKKELKEMMQIFEQAMLPPQRFPIKNYEKEYEAHVDVLSDLLEKENKFAAVLARKESDGSIKSARW